MSNNYVSIKEYFLNRLKEREVQNGQSQQRFAWAKAHRALREAQKDIFSPDDCNGIKGIGPTISKFLAEQFRLGIQNGSIRAPPGYSQPASISPSTSPNLKAKAASAPASKGDEDVVAAFLQPLGKAFSDNYAWALRREGFDNRLILSQLTEADLDSLKVDMPVGHRRTILARSAQLGADPTCLDEALAHLVAASLDANNVPAAPVVALPFPPREEVNPPILADLPLLYSRVIEGGILPLITERFLHHNSAPENVNLGRKMVKSGHIRHIIYNGPLATDPSVSWTAEVINEDAIGSSKVTVRVKENKRTEVKSCHCTCKAVQIDSWKYCEHIIAVLDVLRDAHSRGVVGIEYKDPEVIQALLASRERERIVTDISANVSDPAPMPLPKPKKKRQRKSDAEKAAEVDAADAAADINAVVPSPKRRKNADVAASPPPPPPPPPAVDALGQQKLYIPRFKSGGWAILVAMRKQKTEQESAGQLYKGMEKSQLLEKAQALTDTPFSATANTFYSGWSSMKTLKQHGYVSSYRVSYDTFFKLTALGDTVAFRCEKITQEMQEEQNFDKILSADNMEDAIEIDETSTPPNRTSGPVGNISSGKELFLDLTQDDEALARALQAQFDNEIVENHPSVPPRVDRPPASPSSAAKRSGSSERCPPPPPSPPAALASAVDPIIQPQRSEALELRYPKHMYDIVVLVDYREVTNKQTGSITPHYSNLLDKLKERLEGVRCENRALELGDIMWILRPKPEALGHGNPAPLDEEIVLDCILERKSIDDLFGSVVDKRYEEQKSRLKRTMISRVLYLIEGKLEDRINGIGEIEPIEKMMAATEAMDEFIIMRTVDQTDTANCIAEITRQLSRLLHDLRTPKDELPISSHTYASFKKQFNKSADTSIKRIFVEQLMCLPSVSAARAQVIVQRYPTPATFRKDLLKADGEDHQKALISHLKRGQPPRSLGIQPATAVVTFFSKSDKYTPLGLGSAEQTDSQMSL